MVSSRRVASPTSSLSSYGSSCEYQQACKTTLADGHKDLEQLSVDDDREVARRVLADLEELYFDEDSDGGSGDEDNSRGKRNAGGMTLEELTVAVNAAIEYHRPAKAVVEQPAIAPKSKEDDNLSQYSKDHRPRSRRRHQRKDPPTMSSPTGDSVLELFQDMLERKEKHFHALRAESVNAVAKDNQSRETVTSRTVKVDQQQQTTAYVRDQATETEEYSHRRSLDAEFGVAEFDIPPLSLLSSVHMRPIEVGPMLADLTHIQERHRLSSRPHPASESSWGSSSSSSATNSSFQSSFSSEHSSRSSTIKCVSSRHCHNSTKSSSKARRTSPPSNKSSSSSNHSSRKSQHHAEGEPAIETIEPTDVQSALAQKDQPEEGFQTAVSHLPVDQSQVPSSPELVEWELDLSNFAF
ncbi:hypothetical protein JG687_00001416 [Phytophthora cactorum]|uniref:Uncharacterized protein n=1 Tax=Phytophthora cactorum TaxID=29920 RepID=A0A8T1UZX8_9STRA|nr:hypothetical protein JG687_00001416 [Phytophthora cactorum]